MTALLHLLWLASPALPVGGFSYSDGLEAAVDAGHVATAADASAWLLDQLRLGVARNELAVVAQAVPAWRRDDDDRIVALNDWMLQTRETAEQRQQTEQMGRSMAEWLRHRAGTADDARRLDRLRRLAPAPTWPVAWALAAAGTAATVDDAVAGFGFAWAEGMVQAALKAVPLGQVAGQHVLADLVEALPDAVATALALADADRQSFLPMLAILSARHETQYSRLFRS